MKSLIISAFLLQDIGTVSSKLEMYRYWHKMANGIFEI
jgi:hypothetical protein